MGVTVKAKGMGRSSPSRKVVTNRKGGSFTGYLPSFKNGESTQYESTLEDDYAYLLGADPDVKWFREQPPPITWTDGVSWFTSWFDFEVHLWSGKVYVTEIKPYRKVVKRGLVELFGFARETVRRTTWDGVHTYDDLELWTERELRVEPRLMNAKLLVRSQTTYSDPSHELAMLSAISDMRRTSDTTTIRRLRSASGLDRVGGNGAKQGYWWVIRMIARGDLIPVDPTQALDDFAVVRFAVR